MRKKIIIIAALSLTACGTAAVPEIPPQEIEAKEGLLSVSIKADGQTKSTADWSDAGISSATVLVFNPDGSLDGRATGTSGQIDVRCTQGEGKKVYVVTNKTIANTVTSEAKLFAVNTSLTDNTAGSFVMGGSVSGVEVKATAGEPIEVEVTRYAAKISIAQIKNSITSAGWSSQTFTVKGIYVINASGGNYRLFGDIISPSVWYNKSKYVHGNADDWLYESMSSVIDNGSSLNGTHTFYCYPNETTTDANGGTWSPRHTRLVVEAQIGNRTFYYPITISGITRNTHYTINSLNITRSGSSDPDFPVDVGQFGVQINVSAWSVTNLSTQTI